ncbi:hypothetical protein CF328_g6387 [Tilletia controversa]|nr:hypothetical protein CF328_g6387 [Tilletia controversa]
MSSHADDDTSFHSPTRPGHPTTPPRFIGANDNALNTVVQEVRSMSATMTSRLDGLNVRLGDMEHWRRDIDSTDQSQVSPSPAERPQPPPLVPEHPDSPTPAERLPPPQEHTNFPVDANPPFVNMNRQGRARNVIPPHMLPRSSMSTQISSTKRVLERLGFTLREFLSVMEDDSILSRDDGADMLSGSGVPTTPTTPSVGTPPAAAADHIQPVEASTPQVVPPSDIDPAPNIQVEVSPGRMMSCKPEFLGSFGGDPSRLEAFISRVEDVIRADNTPSWNVAVLRALPICLVDDAAVWHEGLSDDEAAALTSFPNWTLAMREAFPVNRGQLRKDAWNRKWDPILETTAAYYFHKLRLLRQAFGKQQSDDALVIDIKEGLPDNMVALLRLPRNGATLQDLRLELGEWETNWRKQFKVTLRMGPPTPPTTPTPTTVARPPQTSMVRFASAPSTAPPRSIPATLAPAARAAPPPSSSFGGTSMSASYDPSRITPAANGQPRTYRPPGRDTVMSLNRPCTRCGQEHFNFEHEHLVPQLRTMVDDEDDYPESMLEEGTGEGEGNVFTTLSETPHPSPSLENGLAPSMYASTTQQSDVPTSPSSLFNSSQSGSSDPEPTLFFADKAVFSTDRQLRPNETAPPLAQPKRSFGVVVPLPKNPMTGPGKGYRNHVPLTTHIRVNDTDGRAMSTLLDTGATLSCIDHQLLLNMGGIPRGESMTVKGIGNTRTLGWATLPVFLSARDPLEKHVHLEFDQDFHVLPAFPPGLCLGLDFIDTYGVHISPVRGRGNIGRYTFAVHERVSGPYATEAELRTTSDVRLPPGIQTWVQLDASCLAPGVDYTVGPRLCVTPDETVRITGPTALLTHGSSRHILLGNYGSSSFSLERGTPIADAVAARIGDTMTAGGEAFTLQPMSVSGPPVPPSPLPSEPVDAAMPFDAFDEIETQDRSLTQDAETSLVDDAFKVGLDSHGNPHPALVALLRENKSAFALDGRPGRIEGQDMDITLQNGATLQSEPPRRASPEKRAAMDAAIEQLLAWDVIEPSNSPVSFPVVMVRQNGKWRFCVDYRNLNAKTVPDRYPLPTIDAIFQTLCGKKVFSSLDAIRGYHQLGVQVEDRWKTAFVCHRGLFQYAVFQRMMDKVLGLLRWNQAVIYIDDSVVATDTMEEQVEALRVLLRNASTIGLTFSPAKCTFGVPSLTLLGRKVSGAGVAIWADRAAAVRTLARPTTLQELCSKDGGMRLQTGKHDWSIPEGKAVSAGRVPIVWGAPQQTSFDQLRTAISNPPVLAHPDATRPYILYTDASKGALAAILHQVTSAPAPSPAPGLAASLNHFDVPHLPPDLARQHWTGWLAEDSHFGPILAQVRALPTSDDEWVLRDNILVRRLDDRVALPLAALPSVLRALHDERGHFGYMKTLLAVRRHFWRPSLSTAIRAWVKHCSICQSTKSAPKSGSLDISKDPSLPFDTISIDLIYGFPRSQSGNDAALVVQDLFSRMLLLAPCHKEITAEGVAAIISDRVLRFGWRPRRIVSDSEARVSGSVMSFLVHSLGAIATPSNPYHQQANSVERAVQTVQQVLQALSLESKAYWDRRILPSVELAMNAAPSLSTGVRPFDLVFISHPDVVHAVFDANEHLGVSAFDERLAAAHDRLEDARRYIVLARQNQKRRYDARRTTPPLLAPGMAVWIRLKDRPVPGSIQDKLDARKLGPFPIAAVLSAHRVRLQLPASLDIDPEFNIEQLDFVPTLDDPFAADRTAPPSTSITPSLVLDDASVLSSPSDGPAEPSPSLPDAPVDGDPLPLRRSRTQPSTMREFQLGVVYSVHSSAAFDAFRGPLARPRTMTIEGRDVVLTERPVAYLSRLTSVGESKLVAPELELVCLAWAFHKLAHLLEGAQVTVVTDHLPMERMLRSPSATIYGPTVTRCRAVIMPHLHNLRFVYRPGPRHTNVDALSRLIPDQGRPASGGGDVLADR